MFLTNHSSAFLFHDVRVVKNVACLSSLLFKNEEAMYVAICANTAVAAITHKQHYLYC